jgi:hypothetical protein
MPKLFSQDLTLNVICQKEMHLVYSYYAYYEAVFPEMFKFIPFLNQPNSPTDAHS